jgi:hypothetical protein
MRGKLIAGAAAAGAILCVTLAANPIFFRRLSSNFPFEVTAHLAPSRAGSVKATEVRVRGTSFEAAAENLEVRYPAWDFFFPRRIRAVLEARNVALRWRGSVLDREEAEIRFERLRCSLRRLEDGRLEIISLSARGKHALIHLAGSAGKPALDMRLACLLMPEAIRRLPQGIAEHAFSHPASTAQLRLQIGGSWDHPTWALSSDLIRVEVRPREI